jgi:hypothetical protein
METGEQRREEQKQAAADASKYGISATRADGSKKSAEELRGEISTELTNRAKQAEAEAAARRTQRSGGDDDGGGAPDQSTVRQTKVHMRVHKHMAQKHLVYQVLLKVGLLSR